MANKAIVTVSSIKIDTKMSKMTNQEFKEVKIISTDNIAYKTLLDKIPVIPEEGDTAEIVFQETKGFNGNTPFNNILTLKLLKTDLPPWDKRLTNSKEELAMPKKTETATKQYFKIKGILHYAHIKDRDTKGKYPTNQYKTDLTVSETTKTALESLGVLVKNKGDAKGNFVVIKSDYQPVVIDTDGNTVLPESIPLIGNGSKAVVTVTTYTNKAPQGGKVCLGMSKIELETLIPYQPEASFLTTE